MRASSALRRSWRPWSGFRAGGGGLLRAVRYDVLLIGAILAVLWAAIATWSIVGHRTTTATAERMAGSIAGAAEQGMSRTIEAMDQRLRLLRDNYRRDPAGFSLAFLGADNGYQDGMMMQMAFIDADGMLLQTNLGPTDGTLSLVDRPHFRVHLEHPQDLLHISVPVLGRVSKRWSVQFTRKVFGPDGSFAGVLVGSLDPYWMTQLQEMLDVDGSLILLGDDGVVRASAPDLSQIGRALADTELGRAVRRADHGGLVLPRAERGAEQLAYFRHLRNYPLSVVVSLDGAGIFADYRQTRVAMCALGVGLTLLVLGAGTFLVHYRIRATTTQAALKDAIENIDQGLVMLDGNGRLSVCNGRFTTLLHLPDGVAVPGADLRVLLTPTGDAHGRPALMVHGPVAVEERFQPDGSVLEVRIQGLPDGGQVRTYTDVTERWEAEERIFFLAHHDALTGLANRVTLSERLGQALAAARRGGGMLAVMCLDLDRFKHVNDSLGHAVGDELLKQVADRLRDVTRASDIVTRTGGDEFIVVQTLLADGFDAVNGAERIRNAMRVPFLLHGREMVIGTSIGIALFPGETETIEGLLKNADAALYRAKEDGRGGICFFEPSMEAEARERAELEQDLRTALSEEAFELHYQPLFASDAETIVAYEALLRWHHPVRGLVSPARFIPIAEECGLILPLGRWVLEEACRTAAAWATPHVIAVNLSPVQVRRGNVPELVQQVLGQSGLDPSRLELEITEGVLIEDAEGALATLNALKSLGVILALDDFGTGYSSLSYLSRFPFDKLKIDKSFTRGLGTDEGAKVIADTIIAMGKSLRLKVTAEGVETEDQLRFLRRRGCDQFQGFLLGRPRPGNTIERAVLPMAAE